MNTERTFPNDVAHINIKETARMHVPYGRLHPKATLSLGTAIPVLFLIEKGLSDADGLARDLKKLVPDCSFIAKILSITFGVTKIFFGVLEFLFGVIEITSGEIFPCVFDMTQT